jgi:hypothetical protein
MFVSFTNKNNTERWLHFRGARSINAAAAEWLHRQCRSDLIGVNEAPWSLD